MSRWQLRVRGYAFDLRWWLLATVMAAIASGLGVWQLHRADQKAALQDAYYDRLSMRPLACAQAVRMPRPAYVRVQLQGEFVPDHEYLLDNRTHRSVAGYEVLTPFRCRDGTRLLLNRGWIAAGEQRDRPPRWFTPVGLLQLSGFVYVPSGLPPLTSTRDWPPTWPAAGAKRIGYLDVERMQAESPPDQFRFPVMVDAPGPGIFALNFEVGAVSPDRNWGYAAQWFAIAVAILAYLGYRSARRQ